MKSLKSIAEEYLKLRRSLGFKLIDTEYILKYFIAFMKKKKLTYIKCEALLQWLFHSTKPLSLPQKSSRYRIIRKFAQYAHALDNNHEIPPCRFLSCNYKRRNPHIYSDNEILRLLAAFKELQPGNGLRHYIYYTILGLIAVTGMRISEATSLERTDVDFSTGIITIRDTKFGKARCIPVHKSTLKALLEYIEQRDKIFPNAKSTAFFLSDSGSALTSAVLECIFIRISHRIGFRKPNQRYGPRIHDLRHTFAVKTVIKWYQEGANVDQKMPLLSAYLGHVKPSDTYWYLSSVPELVALAANRLDKKNGGQSD